MRLCQALRIGIGDPSTGQQSLSASMPRRTLRPFEVLSANEQLTVDFIMDCLRYRITVRVDSIL
jgi:hypothetical protein